MFVEFFRRRWVPIRVENIFDADETTTSEGDGQLISTARSIRVGVGALRVEQPYYKFLFRHVVLQRKR